MFEEPFDEVDAKLALFGVKIKKHSLSQGWVIDTPNWNDIELWYMESINNGRGTWTGWSSKEEALSSVLTYYESHPHG